MAPFFHVVFSLTLGFFGLGFFLFKAILVFADKRAELWIVVLLTVQWVVKRAFRIFIRHLCTFSLEFISFIILQARSLPAKPG
jgi:hypothetical protein